MDTMWGGFTICTDSENAIKNSDRGDTMLYEIGGSNDHPQHSGGEN